jgi:hypothetical protein
MKEIYKEKNGEEETGSVCFRGKRWRLVLEKIISNSSDAGFIISLLRVYTKDLRVVLRRTIKLVRRLRNVVIGPSVPRCRIVGERPTY